MAECTIYDKLRYIAETKDLIKMAIESQDVEVLESATFRQYAEYITEIRKVSSVNGMQGDVVLTLEDLGGITLDTLEDYATEQWVEDKGYLTGFTIPEEYVTEDDLENYYTKEESDGKYLTEHQSLDNYYTKDEVDNKGYITAIPETYITEDELSTQLKDKVSETVLNEALKGYYDKGEVDNLIENVDVTEQLQNYYTKEEIEAKKYLTEVPSEYITEDELADTLDIITEMGEDIASLEETKQDKLTQGTGIKIENNVISLDYSYDLFEVVTELPTENISDNKIYLVQDTDGGENNIFIEYIYVNGQFEEVGKFKTTVDLTGYATEKWVGEQGYLTEVPDEYVTDTDLGEALDGYATEDWVGEQGFLTEHQSLEDYYTKEEVDEAIDNVDVTEQLQNYYTKEESDGKYLTEHQSLDNYYTKAEVDGKGYLTEVPEGYATEQWVEDKKYLTEHQSLEDYYTKDEVDEAIKNVEVGEDVDLSDYVTKEELPKELYNNKIDGFAYPYVNEIVVTSNEDHINFGSVNPENRLMSETVGMVHFKTINGEHIIGTGDIVIEGGEGGAANIIEITQDEYNEITPEEDALYIISDAPEVTVPTKLSELEQDIEIGKTYTAGDGIKIDNDTISVNINYENNPTSNYFKLNAKNNANNTSTTLLRVNGSDTIKVQYTNLMAPEPQLVVTDKVALKTDISTKQDVLVSGTNIKTINGKDILGEGNITIEGGGGSGNANVIELTQAEFDALTEYEEAFYLITDASSDSDMSNYYTKTEIDALIGGVENKITEINNLI